MFYRSLYFLFHNEHTVRNFIGELKREFGLDDTQLHAIIMRGNKLTELPGATLHSKTPEAIRREHNFLILSVMVFTLALIALVLSLLASNWYLSGLFALLVAAAQLSGYLLGNRIPNPQLDRFRSGLSQGDIVFQVDVPPSECKAVRRFIDERIPGALTGVSNWHTGTIGL